MTHSHRIDWKDVGDGFCGRETLRGRAFVTVDDAVVDGFDPMGRDSLGVVRGLEEERRGRGEKTKNARVAIGR